MRDNLGNKVYANRKDVTEIKPISNQFPTKLELENVPELISTSEKIRRANENLPF